MAIYRMERPTRELFFEAEELAMAVQVGRLPDGDYALVIGGTVALTIDDATGDQLETFPLRERPAPREVDGLTSAIIVWLSQLPRLSDGLSPINPYADDAFTDRLAQFWFSLGYQYFPGPGPLHHVPFLTKTSQNDVFYRWEPFPTSVKINQSGGTIAQNTFAAPYSEAPFVPTGFAAVARYALPQPFPACWRWELQPVPCDIRCGASVPMHGQSGGGVEVKFLQQISNRGPIANPVVIPPM